MANCQVIRVEIDLVVPNELAPDLLPWLKLQIESAWGIEVLFIEEKGVK